MRKSVALLLGSEVKSFSGEYLGKIQDIMVDTSNANVEFAVVSSGGVFGFGETLHAIPLEMFRPGKKAKSLLLDTTREKLVEKSFQRDEMPQHPDMSWFCDDNVAATWRH